MRKITLEDRKLFEHYLSTQKRKSFYQFFPFLFSVAETDESRFRWKLTDDYTLLVYCDNDLYYPPLPLGEIPKNVKSIQISLDKIPHWNTFLYDYDYIYQPEKALNSVKKNSKKLEDSLYVEKFNLKDCIKVLFHWYKHRKKGCFFDAGWVLYVVRNLEPLGLKANLIYERDGTPAGVNVWGYFNKNEAVHLICKTKVNYQDFLRFKLYEKFLDEGVEKIYDGGDLGDYGLRRYKHKFKPDIYPLFELRR